MSSKEISIIY